MTAPTYLYDQGCLVLALLQLSEHQHRQHAENCGKESRHIHDSSWNVPADQKPPWATSPKSRETSPVCSPKRLQKPSRNWPHQRKLMPTGAFQRGRLLVRITITIVSRSLHRHSLTQSKARSYLREDSFEMTSIRGNSYFYTLARWGLEETHSWASPVTVMTFDPVFGGVWTCLPERVKNRGYKNPCLCQRRAHFTLAAIGERSKMPLSYDFDPILAGSIKKWPPSEARRASEA